MCEREGEKECMRMRIRSLLCTIDVAAVTENNYRVHCVLLYHRVRKQVKVLAATALLPLLHLQQLLLLLPTPPPLLLQPHLLAISQVRLHMQAAHLSTTRSLLPRSSSSRAVHGRQSH